MCLNPQRWGRDLECLRHRRVRHRRLQHGGPVGTHHIIAPAARLGRQQKKQPTIAWDAFAGQWVPISHNCLVNTNTWKLGPLKKMRGESLCTVWIRKCVAHSYNKRAEFCDGQDQIENPSKWSTTRSSDVIKTLKLESRDNQMEVVLTAQKAGQIVLHMEEKKLGKE